MRLIRRAGVDPAAQQRFLFGGEGAPCFGWWHQQIFIFVKDSADQFASVAVARFDGALNSGVADIQSQIGFSFSGIGAVTEEAIFGKDRSNVAIEFDF